MRKRAMIAVAIVMSICMLASCTGQMIADMYKGGKNILEEGAQRRELARIRDGKLPAPAGAHWTPASEEETKSGERELQPNDQTPPYEISDNSAGTDGRR
jgi:hypothetical protein